MIPIAARLNAKGSLDPVGFSSIAQKLEIKSILSAKAITIDKELDGTASEGPKG